MTIAESVVQWVRDDYGIELTSTEPIADGLDTADVWRATSASGQMYAVKWSAGGTDAGLFVPAALADAGCRGVAAPVPTRDDRLWSVRDGRRLSVVPWVTGPSGWSTPMGVSQVAALGRVLRAAHELVPGDVVAQALPRESYDPSLWLARCDEVDKRLMTPGPRDDLVDAVRYTWMRARSRILVTRDRVFELAQRLRHRSVRPHEVVCHADSHGGNVVLRGPDDVVLLDWDDAMLAPPERDLMFATSPSVWFAHSDDAAAREGFVEGYGVTVPDREVLAYYRCARAVEDVTELAEWALDTSGLARDRAANLLDGMVAPGGQLDDT